MTARKRLRQLEEKHEMFYEVLKDIQVKGDYIVLKKGGKDGE